MNGCVQEVVLAHREASEPSQFNLLLPFTPAPD